MHIHLKKTSVISYFFYSANSFRLIFRKLDLLTSVPKLLITDNSNISNIKSTHLSFYNRWNVSGIPEVIAAKLSFEVL